MAFSLGEQLQNVGLVLASANPHKLRELQDLLKPLAIGVSGVLEILKDFSVEENGADFSANAVIKARACFEKTGRISLADDSGLSVDALNGRPGVHSARYGAAGLSDRQRCLLLLEELKAIPPPERTAHFSCALALCTGSEEDQIHLFEGRVEGCILERLQGENGFGYDPIFFDPELGMSFAQINARTKNRHSHRYRAIRSFVAKAAATRS